MGDTTLTALFLGVLEGLTEFIPVSSTGHLLLAGHFIGFSSNGKTFEVVIQLGAVLAILTVYSAKLLTVARDAPHDPAARRFILAVLLAFLPAAFVGVLARDFIKGVLFETPMLISITLILGGIVTNGGVASTLRDAHLRNIDTVMLSDGCAAFRQDVHEATLLSLATVTRQMTCAETLSWLEGKT